MVIHKNFAKKNYESYQIEKKVYQIKKKSFFWYNQSSAFKPLIKSKRWYLRNTKLFCKLLPVWISYSSVKVFERDPTQKYEYNALKCQYHILMDHFPLDMNSCTSRDFDLYILPSIRLLSVIGFCIIFLYPISTTKN